MHIFLTIYYCLSISYIYSKGPHQHRAAVYIFGPFQKNDVYMYVCNEIINVYQWSLLPGAYCTYELNRFVIQ